jgi:hypothetical protein
MRHPPSTHATGESAAVVCRHGQARRGGGGRVDPRHYAAPADVPIATVIDDVGVAVKPEADGIESIRTVQPRRLTGSSTTDRR